MKKDILITRVFDAPVEAVWEAWKDPALVMQWWGPARFISPSAEMDFREGGTSLVCMRAPAEFGGQDMYNTWTYTELVPLQRIGFIQCLTDKDWNKVDAARLGIPVDFPEDMRTVVTFKSTGTGTTEMTVTQYDWKAGQMAVFAEIGLGQCLDKMNSIFTR